MGKSSHFIGQPLGQNAQMDETASDYRLYHHNLVLQPYF